MPKRSIAEIETLSARALSAHGAAPQIAAEMARAIAWAEARGNRICGLYYLESYCQQLISGRVDGRCQPIVTTPRAGQVDVDAAHGFAQPAFRAGLAQALAAAQTNGIARLSLFNAHTGTGLGYLTQALAEAGVIALGMTNASPIVAPPGGKTRVLGTNPISFAVPDGQGGTALLFDQSTTTVALGRITMAKAAGKAIPEGWALDAQGQPTTDPAKAIAGSMISTGGYKGWGFGVMVEVLASCLAGGTPSRDVKPLKAPDGAAHDLGLFFVLIHPENKAFYAQIQALAEAVESDPGCRLPGRAKALVDTVDLPDTLDALLSNLSG